MLYFVENEESEESSSTGRSAGANLWDESVLKMPVLCGGPSVYTYQLI
jgi:hypothetical protein